jgi:hypothetical protein
MSNYDIFVRRCRRDPESDAPSIVLVEIQLKPATCVSVIIPLTFAMARVLPHSGVLSTVGYPLSLASRDMVTIDGVLWDSERLLLTPVHKLARAVARARFNDAPHHDPRPLSPDNRSRRSGDSFGTNDLNHRGEFADHQVPAQLSPERLPTHRDRSLSPGRSRRSCSRDHWPGHGNEVVLHATQVRGIFASRISVTSSRMAHHIRSQSSTLLYDCRLNQSVFGCLNHPHLACSWTAQRRKAWILDELCSVDAPPSSAHATFG